MVIDVLERDDLPFPRSLPDFQRRFPNEAAFAAYLERVVTPGATIITDDWSGYAALEKRGYLHTAVAERGDMQIAETFLPIIHLVFSNLKTWLRGIHHGVSP